MAAFAVPTLKNVEDFQVYYVATVLVVILLVRRLLTWPHQPPGPPGLPLVGHMHFLGANPHISLWKLADKYGPLMSFRLGNKPYVVATSPETAKEFLKTLDANFGSRHYSSQSQYLLYGGQDVAFQESSPSWRNLKKIFTMELASPARLEASRHIREEEMIVLLRTIHSKGELELKSQLIDMISHVISRMVINKRFDDSVESDFPTLVQTHFRLAGAFVPGDYIPAVKWLDLGGFEAQMKKQKERMDAFIDDILVQHRERRAKGPVPMKEYDMVHVLLDRIETKDDQIQLTDTHVKALVLDAFLGASETIILTSEWAMAELLRHPSLMAKAQAELDAVVGRDRMVTESDLRHLTYLNTIIKETFRLHPAAALLLPRESAQPSQAFGYNFPAKTRVLINCYAIHRDPAIWHDPLVFNPDRFLQADLKDVDVKGRHFQLLPFGAGRRVCPGLSMGILTVQFILASLLHSFDWSLPGDMKPEDVDMTEIYGLTLPRAAPLPCAAKLRLPSHLLTTAQKP